MPGHYRNILIYLSLALLMLSGCAQTSQPLPAVENVFIEAEESNTLDAELAAPDYISNTLLSGAGQRNVNSQSRCDVAVHKMPARSFFLSLISEGGVNVVTHPDITGQITLSLNNVTVVDVLEVVRDIYGYEFQLKNNIYTIYPRALRTESFPINYIDVKRIGVSDTNVSIGDITSQSGGKDGQSGGGGSGAEISDGSGSGTSSTINPGSRVRTTNITDFWQMIERTVSAIVGNAGEGRNIMVNPQAGLVVVTAMPAELNAVRNFLTKSELIVKRQVILEAKILEVQLKDGFQAGINWSALSGQIQYGKNVTSVDLSGNILNSIPNGPEFFASIVQITDISEILSLLETQGSVQVLSSPRVSTVNNQKAVIRVGSDEFFVTGISNNTTSSAGATTNSPEVELASFFSGISLDVTPQISEDGDVVLHIHPIVSEVTDQLKELTVGDAKFSLPLALREIRESDSIVRAQSGQVIVLGGLMQESSRVQNSKHPYLGSVPLVNALFKKAERQKVKTELVILLKPVVVGEDSWRTELSEFNKYTQTLTGEIESR